MPAAYRESARRVERLNPDRVPVSESRTHGTTRDLVTTRTFCKDARKRQQQQQPQRPDMDGPAGLDDLINQMNLQPDNIPDLDSISLMSGDTDRRSQGGITLNL